MLMILILHCDFLANGIPDELEFKTSPIITTIRYFINSLCTVGVNVFVIISGYFGIKFSGKRLLKFLFYVFYWGIIIGLGLWLINSNFHFLYDTRPLSTIISKVFTAKSYWFIWAYLILMILATPLNYFIRFATNREIGVFLIFYFAIESIGIISNSLDKFSMGYSTLSFIGVYILGGYIKRNICYFKCNGWIYIFLYLMIVAVIVGIFSVITAIPSLHKFGLPALAGKLLASMTYYSGIFNIICATLLLIGFTKFDFHVPFINYVGASAFGVYLLHMHPVIYRTYVGWCHDLWNGYASWEYLGMMISTFIIIFVTVVILDAMRKIFEKFLFQKKIDYSPN